jgi:recombination DNA repair RAD52 pathway protein
MNADLIAVVSDLQEAGVRLSVAGDGQLFYAAPKGIVTDAIKEGLQTRKAELLRILADKPYWEALAVDRLDPEDAGDEQEDLFLTACEILRQAESREQLIKRCKRPENPTFSEQWGIDMIVACETLAL